MKNKISVALSLVILLISNSFGQKKEEDFGMWYGADLSYKIKKGLNLIGGFSIRTVDNATTLRRFHYEIGVEKKIIKGLTATVKYRNRFLFEYDENEINHRFFLDIAYKYKFGKFGVQLRNRMQYTTRFKGNRLDDRIRLKLDYKLEDDLKVFVANELFYGLSGYKYSKFMGYRFAFGLAYELNDKIGLEASYLRTSEFNTKFPEVLNVLQLEVNLKLK